MICASLNPIKISTLKIEKKDIVLKQQLFVGFLDFIYSKVLVQISLDFYSRF